jgi:hypothetical protein
MTEPTTFDFFANRLGIRRGVPAEINYWDKDVCRLRSLSGRAKAFFIKGGERCDYRALRKLDWAEASVAMFRYNKEIVWADDQGFVMPISCDTRFNLKGPALGWVG